MKKLLLCLGFLGIFFINQVNASEIAVINLDEIIKNSTAMTKVNKALESRKADMEKRLKAQEKTLSNEKASLESQIKTLSQDVAQEKVAEFQQKVLNFQKEVRENENSLQKTYMDAIVEITNKIKEIVADMKTEKGSKYKYDVVLPSSAVVFNEKNVDISSEVLFKLNKELKTVKAISSK